MRAEIRADLTAIDATLAGEAVDPRHAELAELSLLLADLRPALEPSAGARVDARVAAVRPRAAVQCGWRRPRLLGGLAGAAAVAGAAAGGDRRSGGGDRARRVREHRRLDRAQLDARRSAGRIRRPPLGRGRLRGRVAQASLPHRRCSAPRPGGRSSRAHS